MRKKSDIKIYNKFKTSTFGFTLAEVLITLVIIGVIAAMTVPALIQQTQKQEYVSGLIKAYSTLQNGLYRISYNHGYSRGDYIFFQNVNPADEYAQVLNILKKCDTTEECMPSSIRNGTYKRLNGAALATAFGDGKTLVLNDGQMYTFYVPNTNWYGISDEDKTNGLWRIIVDLNGWKKPNQFGYDVFIFYLVDHKGIVPAGSSNADDCVKNNYGYTCAAKVLKEKKISY